MKGDLRCIEGRLFLHDPQFDDPDLETDVGECPDCNGKGCNMSLEAWGDEGDVPQHGRETAAYQELSKLRDRLHKWTCDFKTELNPDEMEKAAEALEHIDATLEMLNVPL